MPDNHKMPLQKPMRTPMQKSMQTVKPPDLMHPPPRGGRGGRRTWRACAPAALCLWGALALPGAASAVSTSAQVTPGNQLPAALKDLKQATGACHRDAPDAGASQTAPEMRADLTCAIALPELQTLMKRPDAALLDLRSGTDYQAYHINGALSLHLSDLHSKPYWRNKAVVLVGDGRAEGELYSECTRLKQSGYKQVRVLRGGMPLWLSQHQPVTGQGQGLSPPLAQLVRLPSAGFWLESQNQDNLVLLAKEQSALREHVPFSVVLPQTSAEAIKAVLARRSRELKNAPLASVVLAASPALTDTQIERLQQALQPVPLLVYADSQEALKRQLVQQKAIWLAQARGPKQLGCGL
jgi:rhodanese-related sulfurtransferase